MSGYLAIVQHVLEGGLVRALVSKPVRQSIGRLVSGTADVGNAYLESWAQRKRSDTLAEKQITGAVAARAKELVAADLDLARRGLDRWTRKLAARQESVDEVAIRTIGILNEKDIPADAAAPSEDFMRMFEDMAERATTESIADLLARVLAGEIRKPGSVSRRALQVVATMDQEMIQAIEYLRLRMFDPGWTFVPDGDGEFAKHADLAESVSIIRRSDMVSWRGDENGDIKLQMGKKAIVAVTVPNNAFFVSVISLTPIGREILALLPPRDEDRYLQIALGLTLMPTIGRVDIGDLEHREGRLVGVNRKALLSRPPPSTGDDPPPV